jgi:hypothetical protein
MGVDMNALTLDQRIAQLQGQMTPPPQMPTLPALDLSALRGLVMEETQRAIAAAMPSLTAPISTPVTPPMDLGTQLLNAVGVGLTEEQQIWLSDPSNQRQVPDFLRSIEGQAFTRRFFSTYKTYLEKTCK